MHLAMVNFFTLAPAGKVVKHYFVHSLTLLHRGIGDLKKTYTVAKFLKVQYYKYFNYFRNAEKFS